MVLPHPDLAPSPLHLAQGRFEDAQLAALLHITTETELFLHLSLVSARFWKMASSMWWERGDS